MKLWLCVIGAIGYVLAACTDPGVVGEAVARPPPDAAAAGDANTAGSQPAPAPSTAMAAPDAAACPFGICTLPPLCNPDLGFCLFCESDADCTGNTPDVLCNTLIASCVQCRNHADCPVQAPFCEGGECGDCADDDDCGRGLKCNDGVCEPD